MVSLNKISVSTARNKSFRQPKLEFHREKTKVPPGENKSSTSRKQKFHPVETKVSPARYKKFLQTKQLNCLQFHPDNTCKYLLTVLILLPHLPSASAG
jgi:GMP synthase-like glutamine amidotransferase